jgi:hypothetical protein
VGQRHLPRRTICQPPNADSRFLIYPVISGSELSAKVLRVDVETGRRTLWKEIIPSDPSGATIGQILLTPDGRSYAYGLRRDLSKLYLAEGLQ